MEVYPEGWPAADQNRRYDKGEDRRKHLGISNVAEIVWDRSYGECVGKCPKGFSLKKAQQLTYFALPQYSNRSLDKPHALWAYWDGAIYRARTSDGGTTWHGFPDLDPPVEIKDLLEELARYRGEERKIKKFMKQKCEKK